VASVAARPRLDAVTSLRFFAAMHVLLFHLQTLGLVSGGPAWLQEIRSVGYLGVSFFFVLSGFILVYTYVDRPFRAREFWQARFARIYPAYAASLVIALPMFLWFLIHLNFPFLAWTKDHLSLACLMVATLTQSWVPQIASAWNPVAWSLGVEAFFYACFPLLFPRIARASHRGLLVWIAAAWTITLLLTGGYAVFSPDGVAHTNSTYENLFWLNVVRFNPLVSLPEFVVGMAAGFACVRSKLAAGSGIWFTVGGIAAFALAVGFSQQIPYPMLHSGLLAPVFASIIFGVALRPRWTRVLEWRWLVLFGEVSYSFYLIHFVVIWAAIVRFGRAAASPIGILAVLVVAFAISVASYKLIEQPARRKLRAMNLRQLSTAAANA